MGFLLLGGNTTTRTNSAYFILSMLLRVPSADFSVGDFAAFKRECPKKLIWDDGNQSPKNSFISTKTNFPTFTHIQLVSWRLTRTVIIRGKGT